MGPQRLLPASLSTARDLALAFGGGRLRRVQVAGERYANKPDKNEFSHVVDGLQYALLGSGEVRALTRHYGEDDGRGIIAAHDLDPMVSAGR